MKTSETAFASQVESLLETYHWKWMHIKPSIMQSGRWASSINEGGKGWLDYIALRPPRILVVELKDDYTKMTPEQGEWFKLWQSCEVRVASSPECELELEVYLWRPKDIIEILRILK